MRDDVYDDDYTDDRCDKCGADMVEWLSSPMDDGKRRIRHICPVCGYEWVQALDGSETWNDDNYVDPFSTDDYLDLDRDDTDENGDPIDYDQPDENGYFWMYGHFTGTDPRDFFPDYELCTEDEIANWQADCEAWNKGEGKPAPPPGTTLYDAEGNWIGHILAPRYGIGTYRYRDDDESAK